MWNPQRASVTFHVPQPSTSEAETSVSNTSSPGEAVYKCTCSTPEASRNWIGCDGDECPVEWHHWECVGVTEEPTGDWFCPKCSQKWTKEALPLNQPRGGKTSMFPKLGKPAAARFNDALDGGNKRKQVVARKMPLRAKKGIAVKKAPLKKNSKWTGWVETSSEGEEEHKGSVNAAQYAVRDAEGRRARRARAIQSKGRLIKSQKLRGA